MDRRSFLRLVAALPAYRAASRVALGGPRSTAEISVEEERRALPETPSKFIHLHVHTEYSLLDSTNRIAPLIKRAAELGMPAMAITDHGNMFGAVEFYKRAVAAGIKPILGCEVYVAPTSRTDRVGSSEDYEAGGNYHLTLLAMNEHGYRNLCRLVTAGFTEGFYYKPRVDKELLREWNAGIIALSGCLSSEVNSSIAEHNLERARKVMEEHAQMFGDRYYVEIQDNKLEIQIAANRELVRLAGEMGLPLVATNDCHYLHAEDAKAHEVLLCIQAKRTRDDPKAWKLGTDELYVKEAAEMAATFAALPEAVSNTVAIADRCNVELRFGGYRLPAFGTPPGETIEEHLDRSAREGLESLLTHVGIDPDSKETYRERLGAELVAICDLGVAGYFAIVADLVGEAKRRGIPVGPGRGSVAGSLVCYALGITAIDPIRHGLLFERFLNPERKLKPDIDIDFCFERRDEIIAYVKEKYGSDRVAGIVAFGTFKRRQAIKDVGRVLGFTFAETDRLARLYPAPKQGRDYPFEKALEMEPRLREFCDAGPGEKHLFEHASKLGGLVRHTTIHASGIVISDRPLVEDTPLFVDPEGAPLTQYDYDAIDAIGLVKFDFLGLNALTLIENVVRRVNLDLPNVPLDDAKTYRLLAGGETVGIFHMEGGSMRNLLTNVRPSCFEDLATALALDRPFVLDWGIVRQLISRKRGAGGDRCLHPAIERILKDTYGVVVFQEQVMEIAVAIAGYTLGAADNLRRVLGRKRPDELCRERARFLAGARNRAVSPDLAAEIFDQLEAIAPYSFNKAHAVAYAFVSYQTAYLKAHYPREFMAALLTMEMGDVDRTYKNIADCKRQGIPLLPPDVNESRENFTVVDEGIRFGLSAVRGVGYATVDKILAARSTPFVSYGDFCLRVGGPAINKRVIEKLIQSGAFDSFGFPRASLIAACAGTMQWAGRATDDARWQQRGLFRKASSAMDEPPTPAIVQEWSREELLRQEKEALGVYLSGHPLDEFREDLRDLTDTNSATLSSRSPGGRVTIAGVIFNVGRKNTRMGERYATFSLDDDEGVVEVVALPEVYRRFEEAIRGEDPVLVTGTLDEAISARDLNAGNDLQEPVDERGQIVAAEVSPIREALRLRGL